MLLISNIVNSTQIRFKHLDLSSEIPNVTIRTMVSDQTGYLWLGTDSGLWRYDGYTLKSYAWINGTNQRLGVKKLFVDKNSSLWVGTAKDGLFKLDSNNVETFNTNQALKNKLKSNTITAFVEDSDGLWVGSHAGLNLI